MTVAARVHLGYRSADVGRYNVNTVRTSSNHSSRGERILRDPLRNKDSAFTPEEREQLGLRGLLPSAVLTIEQQVAVELERLSSKTDPLEQYIGLRALLDRNETLFYRVIVEHLDRLTPIIYTPTVGLACQRYSHICRRPRGLFITPADRGHIVDRLRNFRPRDIRLIVVTDNERILGLGDQGAGGLGISIGKTILYSAGAGIHPTLCLPVSLDVGTDNAALLNDPCYLGHRAPRLRGAEYDALVEEFVCAVKKIFPRALLQWEDFKKGNAFRLMDRYAERLPSFNDDIQGTAGVTLAGVLTALKITGQRLRDQRFLLAGTGAAGGGIGRLLRTALLADGLDAGQARSRLLFLDSAGLVWAGRSDLEPQKREVAWSQDELSAAGLREPLSQSLAEIIEVFRPSVLIGTTGQPGDFTPAVIRALAAHCPRPVIFPLSNPTNKAECTAADALQHSEGRALVGTGSPFDPVTYDGVRHVIGQCNNAFVFPGVGLGVLVSEARRVTNSMFLAAAQTLAEFTGSQSQWDHALYPNLQHLRAISRRIALRVAQTARDEGTGKPKDDKALEAAVDEFMWYPAYEPITSVR